MKETKTLYRYDREYAHFDDGQLQAYKITLKEYEVYKTTPQGYRINKLHGVNGAKRDKFILSGDGKRFAYETKELAWNSFRIRTRKSVMHCKGALNRAEIFAEMLKKEEKKRVVEYSY